MESDVHGGRPFHIFSYDWRRDIWETSDALIAFVRSVSALYNNSKVQIIAHSNGGLQTMILLNRAPGLAHSVVFAGTPFRGSYGNLQGYGGGETLGLANTKSIDVAAHITISNNFVFLPLLPAQQARESFLLDSATREPVALNLSDPAVWAAWAFSPVVTGGPSSSSAHYTSLGLALQRATLARRFIKANATISYPPPPSSQATSMRRCRAATFLSISRPRSSTSRIRWGPRCPVTAACAPRARCRPLEPRLGPSSLQPTRTVSF